jgi:hypothetical protein
VIFPEDRSNRLLEAAGLSAIQNDSLPILTCYEELETLANQLSGSQTTFGNGYTRRF